MNELTDTLAKAQQLLAADKLDNSAYSTLENFVLKNGSRLASNPLFQTLTKLLGEIAQKFGIKSVESIRESFGANSCAQ